MLGQPILYVPLSGSRVLSVAAPCQVARKFAARAVPATQRLNASGGFACTRSPTPLLCCGPTAVCWCASARGGAAVPRTVFLLGLTSLFTDISSEMVVTILPLYLVYVGGFTPLAFGVIDGIYNGAAALVGLASGFVGDRFRRHKEVATAGYGLSAVVQAACSPPSAPRCRPSARRCSSTASARASARPRATR